MVCRVSPNAFALSARIEDGCPSPTGKFHFELLGHIGPNETGIFVEISIINGKHINPIPTYHRDLKRESLSFYRLSPINKLTCPVNKKIRQISAAHVKKRSNTCIINDRLVQIRVNI